MVVAYLVIAYVLAGVAVAIFVAVHAAPLLLPGKPAVSAGTRILLMPASALLWPLIVQRWMAREREGQR